MAIEEAAGEHLDLSLVRIAVSALFILFSMWWLYFSKEEQLERTDLSRAFVWGYGHVLIYASGAAVGAGIAVSVDIVNNHADVTPLIGSYAIAIPVAIYCGALWTVRDRFALRGIGRSVLPMLSIAILLLPLTSIGLEAIAAMVAVGVAIRAHFACTKSQ